MSGTFNVHIFFLCLFLLVAAAEVQTHRSRSREGIRFTTPSWENIRIAQPFNISWTSESPLGGVTLSLASSDGGSVDNHTDYTLDIGIHMTSATSHLWTPTPELFGEGMKQWTRERLWHVEIFAIGSTGEVNPNDFDLSPDFPIAPALDQGSSTGTSGSVRTAASTATSDSTPTKDPGVGSMASHYDPSTAAKAGVGIGSAVAAILLAGLVAWIVFRYRRGKHEGHLTLYSGRPANQPLRVPEYHVPSMIPDCPEPAAPPYTAVSGEPYHAEKNESNQVFELPGDFPTQAAEFPCSSAQPAELPGSRPPSTCPTAATSPGNTDGTARHTDSIISSAPATDLDWRYDPVRGSYTAPESPPASPTRSLMGMTSPTVASGSRHSTESGGHAYQSLNQTPN